MFRFCFQLLILFFLDVVNPLVELEKLCNVTLDDQTEPLANPVWPLMIARMIAMERVVMEDDNSHNDDDATSKSNTAYCARCGAGASEERASSLLRCSRCTNGVETFYCNETCQKNDWR